MFRIINSVVLLLLLCSFTTASAQAEVPVIGQSPSPTVTAAATADRVRFTAPSSVVQMHLEVYSADGEKLFDIELKRGNVLDWHLQDGQAERILPGSYLCVVTVKNLSGKLTQKIGTVTIKARPLRELF